MIHTVAETGSTNADVLAALAAGEAWPEGDWLIADRQVAGRGRQGRNWFDGSGNFMGSTVVRLAPNDPSPASLALVAGLAVYEAVLPVLPEPSALRIKWPNDLTIANAKLAGILLERQNDAVVVGIGVNIRTAPELSDRRTISLSELTSAPDRNSFAGNLARSFVEELARWRNFGLEVMVRRWVAAAHPVGTGLTVNPPGEAALTGKFDGLTSDGALKLRLADGTSRVIHAGDVMFAGQES